MNKNKAINWFLLVFATAIVIGGLDLWVGLTWPGSIASKALGCLFWPFGQILIAVFGSLAAVLPLAILLLPLILIFMFIAGAVGCGVRMGK